MGNTGPSAATDSLAIEFMESGSNMVSATVPTIGALLLADAFVFLHVTILDV